MIISGKAVNDQCMEAWEAIVRRQQKESGSNQYDAIVTLSKAYLKYLNDHVTIRANLILVGMTRYYVEWKWITALRDAGYMINTETPDTILESVNAGLRRCENLITKATSKRKEIEKMMQDNKKSKGDEFGFTQLMAHLNFALGYPEKEDITLSQYNEYQKILKAKAKANEEAANGRNRKG